MTNSEGLVIDLAEDERSSQEQRRRRRKAATVAGAGATGEAMKSRAHRPKGHGHGPGAMVGEKPKNFGKSMRRLISVMGAFKLALVLVFVFAIGSVIFNIVGPKVLSVATTVLFEGAIAKVSGTGGIDFDAIGKIVLATLLIYLFSSFCAWVQSWMMASVSQKTCYDLRRQISEKIDRIPFSEFDNTSTGDTLSRITNDVDTIGQSLNQGVTQLITSIVTIIGVIVMMLSINWIMTLIALCTIPISAVAVIFIVKKSQRHFFAQQALLGQVNAQAEEAFSGYEVVKAFGHEDESVEDYCKANDALYEASWKAQFLSSCMRPAMEFIGNLGYMAVAVSGAMFAVAQMITVGDIQAFIQYVKNLTQPISQLAQISNVFQQMAAASERIFEFIDQSEIEPTKDIEAISGSECEVKFENISFGYNPEKPVIENLTISAACGDTVAIVGPTGAGKTTIVKLLMRFYDVDAGVITIGGTDIRHIKREDVRSLFGMVLQDTWLFKGTIKENIRYGRIDATDEEIEDACKRASAHKFISSLPKGYDFEISEGASNLSLGQRQLLTIARAFLANRKMLILDEATSSVDTRTELRIQHAMTALMQDRTSFVIAHRLSTIRDADLIIVMDHGGLKEAGTHNELMQKGGFYADLYNSQFTKAEEQELQI